MLKKSGPPEAALAAAQARVAEANANAAQVWTRYDCRLVTPMLGGGVSAGEVDAAMPIRATAIRGQLRFWWRLLREHGPEKLRGEALFKREREIWGGLGSVDELSASKVLVRVEAVQKLDLMAYADYKPDAKGSLKSFPEWRDGVPGYTLFSTQGKVSQGVLEKAPRILAKPGLKWTLAVSTVAMTEAQCNEFLEALRWWATFGGVGARTRRGLGAIEVVAQENRSVLQVTPADFKVLSDVVLRLDEKSCTDPMEAWKRSVEKLRTYRQAEDVGRNKRNTSSKSPAGRSRWPEPDAIRRLTDKHFANHKPVHEAGNVFPRAAFGMPIISHFKDRDEPGDTSLQPADADRMASPVILRPYRLGKDQWCAAALRLPVAHVWNRALVLTGKGVRTDVALPAGQWWPSDVQVRRQKAALIKPMTVGGRVFEDPLSAFLEFFAPEAGQAALQSKALQAVATGVSSEESWDKCQLKFNAANGALSAKTPKGEIAAVGDKGRELFSKIPPQFQAKLKSGGFVRATAVVRDRELVRLENHQ